MRHLEAEEFTGSYVDADGDEHEHTVRAIVIGPDDVYVTDQNGNNSRREFKTIAGHRQVSEGDVYVETERPGEYDYLSAAAWAGTSYGGSSEDGDDSEEKAPVAKKAASKRALPNASDS